MAPKPKKKNEGQIQKERELKKLGIQKNLGSTLLDSGIMASLSDKVSEHSSVTLDSLPEQELRGFTSKFVGEVTQESRLFKERVENMTVAVVNPNAAKKKKKKAPPKVNLNAREKRRLGLYHIPEDCRKFEMYEALHSMWKQYIEYAVPTMSEVNPKSIEFGQGKLVKCDYHGCLMTVSKSKIPSFVGVTGIMIKETKNVFSIITRDNQLKEVPKLHSVFTFEAGGFRHHLYGNQLVCQSAERSAKKFKAKPTIDL